MAAPVINTTQSVLGYLQWQTFAFQPWASNSPTFWNASPLAAGTGAACAHRQSLRRGHDAGRVRRVAARGQCRWRQRSRHLHLRHRAERERAAVGRARSLYRPAHEARLAQLAELRRREHEGQRPAVLDEARRRSRLPHHLPQRRRGRRSRPRGAAIRAQGVGAGERARGRPRLAQDRRGRADRLSAACEARQPGADQRAHQLRGRTRARSSTRSASSSGSR